MSAETPKISTNENGISVIGLGPMGQAMARAYLASGYSVTVWNRTTSKAKALAEDGATRAETVRDALGANQMTIFSLTEYDVMYKVLNGATDVLKNRVLVNLSSDTPEKVQAAEKWIHSYSAKFLSGGVMVDPSLVGKPDAFIFYSGNREVFDAHQSFLEVLGKPEYLGNDAGLSQLYYQALLNIMYTSAASVLHSIAMVNAVGIPATKFEPYVMDLLGMLPYFFNDLAKEIDLGEYNGEENNMRMMAAGAQHVAQTARDTSVRTDLTDLISELYLQTVAAGHGQDGLASVIEVLMKQK